MKFGTTPNDREVGRDTRLQDVRRRRAAAVGQHTFITHRLPVWRDGLARHQDEHFLDAADVTREATARPSGNRSDGGRRPA